MQNEQNEKIMKHNCHFPLTRDFRSESCNICDTSSSGDISSTPSAALHFFVPAQYAQFAQSMLLKWIRQLGQSGV